MKPIVIVTAILAVLAVPPSWQSRIEDLERNNAELREKLLATTEAVSTLRSQYAALEDRFQTNSHFDGCLIEYMVGLHDGCIGLPDAAWHSCHDSFLDAYADCCPLPLTDERGGDPLPVPPMEEYDGDPIFVPPTQEYP